jgi:hypothetical protein
MTAWLQRHRFRGGGSLGEMKEIEFTGHGANCRAWLCPLPFLQEVSALKK